MRSTIWTSERAAGAAALALGLLMGLAAPASVGAQGQDPAALSQMLDQLSEEQLAALLLEVKQQRAGAAPAAPRYAPAAPRVSRAERLANLRLEVAARDTAAGILQSLGPAGAEAKVSRIVHDLVNHAYQRTGPFSHSPRRGRSLSSGEAKLLAGKIQFEVEKAMGDGAPFSLSPQARQVFENQIMAAAPGEPAAMQAQVRALTAAKLASSQAPARPLSPEELEDIDEAYFAAIVKKNKIDNHSSQVWKQWAEEEARRKRRDLVAQGPVAARAWLRRQR